MPHSQRPVLAVDNTAAPPPPHDGSHDNRTITIGGNAAPTFVINGDQHVNSLLFQIDGKVYPISKLRPDDMAELFLRCREARRTATMVCSSRVAIWALLTAFAVAIIARSPLESTAHLVAAVATLIVLSGIFWLQATVLIGPALRIQQRVRRELEEREALLRVELALATPHRRRTWRQALAAAWCSYREAIRS